MEFNNYIDALKATKKQHEEEAERLGKMIAEEEARENPAKVEEPVIEETEKKFAYEFTDDEKKVMKGLECCGTEDDGDICEKCPYADASTECSDKNREALELIKKLAGLYKVVVSDLNDLANKYVKIREEADSIHADRDAALKKIDDLEGVITLLKGRIGGHAEIVQRYQRKIFEQDAEIKQLNGCILKYAEAIGNEQRKSAELQNQVEGMSTDLENWKKAAYGYKYAEEQAVKDTAIAKEANESIKENAANLMKENKKLNDEISKKDFEITCLKLRLAARDFGVSAATASDKLCIANLKRDRDEWKEKYEKCCEEVDRLTSDNGQLTGYVSGLEYENKELREQIEQLKKDLQEARTTYNASAISARARFAWKYKEGYDAGRKEIVEKVVEYIDGKAGDCPYCFTNKDLFKQFCNQCLEG